MRDDYDWLARRLFDAETAVAEHLKAKRAEGDRADETLWSVVLGYRKETRGGRESSGA